MEEKKNAFKILNAVNVNEHTEVKDTGKTRLTYLSWAWAWAEVKNRYPEASYEIINFNGLPYVFDVKTGYMVYTTVTIEGITHEMWLPVMDGNNRAMLDHPYEVQTKYNKFTVQAATMFDINKTVMRCLTKNLAMFGLGLYIYAGEDLPEVPEEETTTSKQKSTPTKTNKKEQSAKAEPKDQDKDKDQDQKEDPKIKEIRDAAKDFVNYCNKHGYGNRIPEICNTRGLGPKSTAEDYIMAKVFVQTLVEGDQKNG